jgi:hypothetical protein
VDAWYRKGWDEQMPFQHGVCMASGRLADGM